MKTKLIVLSLLTFITLLNMNVFGRVMVMTGQGDLVCESGPNGSETTKCDGCSSDHCAFIYDLME